MACLKNDIGWATPTPFYSKEIRYPVVWLNEKRTTVVYKAITKPTTYTTKEVVQ